MSDAETAPVVVQTRPVEFWLVWSKGSPRNPRFTHQTRESAQAEARRLAVKHPNRRWFVVKAVERLWVDEAEDKVTEAVQDAEAASAMRSAA